MVRNHENPGLPESSNAHDVIRDRSAIPEWRPPRGIGGSEEVGELGSSTKAFNLEFWNEFPPDLKSSAEGPNSFTTKTTGYWPAPDSQAKAEKWSAVAMMEGGAQDREGKLIWPDHTIDAVEAKMKSGQLWPDDYVAVAMDSGAYPYGTNLTSPAYPGIPFRVVDTGGAFQWKWTSKVDIATSNYDRMNELTADNVRFEKTGGIV